MLEFFKRNIKGDRVIWLIIGALAIFSLMSVYSASGTLAYKYQGGNATHYLLRQAVLLLMGFFIVFIVHRIPYRYFSKLSLWAYYLAVFLLFVTLIWGMSLNQASRWIMLPGGISFQTSDFAKLALMMYLARVLAIKEKEIKNLKTAFRLLFIPIILVCGLIMPADLSTAVLLFGTAVVLMIIGRVNIRYIGVLIGSAIVAGGLVIAVAFISPETSRVGTWSQRITDFFNEESEGNFQAEQSKIAIATGGFIGKGPGNSVQRNILPHPYSDFIFAIIIEEYGCLIGGLFLISLFVYLFYRVVIIVRKVDRKFGAYVSIGLAAMLSFQAMAHMAVSVNIIPVTGQTLPLVSMGGSSIIITSLAFGVILSVSREVMEREKIIALENSTDEIENQNLSPEVKNEMK
ncbi:MAG TPA: putative peptidoglycan glycosyltransferase FtsW [Bacteroidales bacterium]|nr:putative peptidoglycan glycosyltransferase FtsW [Bacteroidales bacterium]HXK81288.1 putative peptidoglycan glycosyltransferase FtsW [Bacteroidales bacterium]